MFFYSFYNVKRRSDPRKEQALSVAALSEANIVFVVTGHFGPMTLRTQDISVPAFRYQRLSPAVTLNTPPGQPAAHWLPTGDLVSHRPHRRHGQHTRVTSGMYPCSVLIHTPSPTNPKSRIPASSKFPAPRAAEFETGQMTT